MASRGMKCFVQFQIRTLSFKCKSSAIGVSLVATTTCVNDTTKKKPCHAAETSTDYKQLIQFACSSSSNSSTYILTLLMQYIIHAAEEYKNELNRLTAYVEENIEALSYNLTQSELEDRIIASRNNVQAKRSEYLKIISMIPYVENLVNATAQISFLFDCEQLSSLIGEQLYSVHEKIKLELLLVKETEKNNFEAESQLIYKIAEKEKQQK